MAENKNRYKEGTIAWKILNEFGEEQIKNLTSAIVAKRINCKQSTAKWAIRKIKDDLQIGCGLKIKKGGGENNCYKCNWWRSLSGDDSNPNACLFCFLNGHSRRKDETGCLEYDERKERGRKRVLRSENVPCLRIG